VARPESSLGVVWARWSSDHSLGKASGRATQPDCLDTRKNAAIAARTVTMAAHRYALRKVPTQTVNGQPGKGDWLRRGTYGKARKHYAPAAVPVPFSKPFTGTVPIFAAGSRENGTVPFSRPSAVRGQAHFSALDGPKNEPVPGLWLRATVPVPFSRRQAPDFSSKLTLPPPSGTFAFNSVFSMSEYRGGIFWIAPASMGEIPSPLR